MIYCLHWNMLWNTSERILSGAQWRMVLPSRYKELTLSAPTPQIGQTLKQFVDKLPTNWLSVFHHFVALALKRLNHFMPMFHLFQCFRLFRSICVTHFIPLVSFYTPWKHQKTRGFLMFSGGLERDQWHEMG